MENIEVYPYQRIPSPGKRRSPRRRRSKSRWPHLNLHRGRESAIALFRTVRSAATPATLFLGVIGFIMARALVLGELLPFVFAFIVSMGRRDIGRTIILTGSAIAGMMAVSEGTQPLINLLALVGLAAVVQLIRVPGNRQWWSYPLLTAAFLIVCKGSISLIAGPSFYQGMVIVFEALIAGVLVFVFDIAGQAMQVRKSLSDFQFEDIAAFLIIAVGIAIGLNGIIVVGLNLGSIFCRLCILSAAYFWGSGAATMVGVMAGLIPSLASSIFTQYLGMYALSGLLAGLFRSLGRLGIIMGFLMGNLALAMFVPETHANVLGIQETAVACLFFAMLPNTMKEGMPQLKPKQPDTMVFSAGTFQQQPEPDVANCRMDELADFFETLGRTFAGNLEKPNGDGGQDYYDCLYDRVCQGVCHTCISKEKCWGTEFYHTSRDIMEIFARAEAQGVVGYNECPPGLRQKCPRFKDIINIVQYLFDNLRINEYWSGKFKESQSLVSEQLSGISQIMRNLARENQPKPEVDEALRNKLAKAARERGLQIRDIRPWVNNGGWLSVDIELDSCRDGQGCEKHLTPIFSSIMGEFMTVSSKECPACLGQGPCRLTLTRSHNYNVRCGAAQVGKESTCGDSFTMATLKEGKQLLALSDGMGVGENASRESQAAIQLLENLLGNGFGQDLSLQTINSILLLRSLGDTFATLDLAVIDLYSGETDFVKTGAAPSFIKRKGRVWTVSASSLPVGILEEIEVFRDHKPLCPGDMVVMVSDGVTGVLKDSGLTPWIEGFLRRTDESDPQVLAENILQKALTLCHGQPPDDMTVICMAMERSLP